MTAQFLVVILDGRDPDRGELRYVDSPADLARYVETLLEGGYDQSNIRVFEANEIHLEVNYRPVVSLGANSGQPAVPISASSQTDAPPDEGREQQADRDDSAEAQGMRNGVRFSELFRPS
jgi:hypothetical protein